MNNRSIKPLDFYNLSAINHVGLSQQIICAGIDYTYQILDIIDSTLLQHGANRLSELIELANLSSVLGNLLATGIEKNSLGTFRKNGPHKYPDLLAQSNEAKDIEIKIAMEDNKPKGHLAKAGFYLTCRYVLGDENGKFIQGTQNRGNVIWIWEIRAGWLEEKHFNLSNTDGDSGKTAVINAEGMKELLLIYMNWDFFPYSKKGNTYRKYQKETGNNAVLHLI